MKIRIYWVNSFIHIILISVKRASKTKIENRQKSASHTIQIWFSFPSQPMNFRKTVFNFSAFFCMGSFNKKVSKFNYANFGKQHGSMGETSKENLNRKSSKIGIFRIQNSLRPQWIQKFRKKNCWVEQLSYVGNPDSLPV